MTLRFVRRAAHHRVRLHFQQQGFHVRFNTVQRALGVALKAQH